MSLECLFTMGKWGDIIWTFILYIIAKSDPVTCAIYAKQNNRLRLAEWKKFARIENRQKKLLIKPDYNLLEWHQSTILVSLSPEIINMPKIGTAHTMQSDQAEFNWKGLLIRVGMYSTQLIPSNIKQCLQADDTVMLGCKTESWSTLRRFMAQKLLDWKNSASYAARKVI